MLLVDCGRDPNAAMRTREDDSAEPVPLPAQMEPEPAHPEPEGHADEASLGRNCAESYIGAMAQMNISIPDKLKGWVESRVAEGRYSSTSDYVRDLVRRDQEAEEARRRLQVAIDEGLASGISDRTIEDIIAASRGKRAEIGD